MVESFTKSMQGPQAQAGRCRSPGRLSRTRSNIPRTPSASPTAASRRPPSAGRTSSVRAKAACNTCHGGPELTDGKIHEVGLEEPDDAYRGYNPPSLRGLYDKDPYLHDGRSKTLRDALSGPHSADNVTGLGELTEQELDDLIAYLKSL